MFFSWREKKVGDGGDGIGYIFVANHGDYDVDDIDDGVDDDVKVGVRKDGGRER